MEAESESGSRTSQGSSLVGAFRPPAPPTSASHVLCPSISSARSHLAHEDCNSLFSWNSPPMNEWLPDCKQSTDTTPRDRMSYSRKRSSHDCATFHQVDQGSAQHRTSATLCSQPTHFTSFSSTKSKDLGAWEIGDQKVQFSDGCALDRLQESCMAGTTVPHSRSAESLLDLQDHRPSSSISMVSVGGMDVERSSYCPDSSKIPLADRENLISFDQSPSSLDVGAETAVHKSSPRSANRNRQWDAAAAAAAAAGRELYLNPTFGGFKNVSYPRPQFYTAKAMVPERVETVSMTTSRKTGMKKSTSSFVSYTDGQPEQLSLDRHLGGGEKEYGADSHLLASADVVPDSGEFQAEGYGCVAAGFRPRVGQDPPLRPLLDMGQKERRYAKWNAMLNSSKSWLDRNRGVKFRVFKKMIRRGIPDELRGRAWMTLSGGSELKEANPGVFGLLLKEPCDADHLIRRDLHRTFPNHAYFKQEGGAGQQALFDVLRAYAIHDPEVCYVQGMGSIVAVLLLYMQEEDAFWTFAALMKPPVGEDDHKHFRRGIRSLYVNGLPLCTKLNMQFEFLLAKKYSRLFDSLAQEGYEPTMYATKWWMTLFTFSLPFAHVIRVWDIFMLEGWKMGMRVGLAIMKTLEKHLVGNSFDTLIERITPEYLGSVISSTNEFIKASLKIRVSRGLNQWDKQHNPK